MRHGCTEQLGQYPKTNGCTITSKRPHCGPPQNQSSTRAFSSTICAPLFRRCLCAQTQADFAICGCTLDPRQLPVTPSGHPPKHYQHRPLDLWEVEMLEPHLFALIEQELQKSSNPNTSGRSRRPSSVYLAKKTQCTLV